MYKTFLIGIILLISFSSESQTTVYDFTVENINGEEISLSKYKGKKILIVNTASKCGLTGQYEQLETIYKKYGGANFEIIGFPANNFLKQEPGTAQEIRDFCTKNYGVSFPMMGKISVKGDDIASVYQWLTQKNKNGVVDSKVKWNFQKYLIDESGQLVKVISPRTKPDDEEIISWIVGKE